MNLNVRIRQRSYSIPGGEVTEEVIAEIISGVDPADRAGQVIDMNTTARLCFADECTYGRHRPCSVESHLRISLRRKSGFGAFIWIDGEDKDTALAWISDNPAPPDFDPRLDSDPGNLLHDPASAVPVGQFMRVLRSSAMRVQETDQPAWSGFSVTCVVGVATEKAGLRLACMGRRRLWRDTVMIRRSDQVKVVQGLFIYP